MKVYTVKQVAELSGVSVRTLHHYDQIGLLKPAFIGENRYRYYGRDELLRLQQILFHREIGMALRDIAAVLDDPRFDRVAALSAHRSKLAGEARRYRQLVKTIDRTIAELKGDREMSDTELYKGFAPAKQAEYEKWLVDRYGGDMEERIATSKKKVSQLSEAEMQAIQAEQAEISEALADAMRHGVPPQAAALDPLLQRHRDWVAYMWDKPCPPEAYAGLADLYLSHPDFVARYDGIEAGFCNYLTTAMKAWAKRQDKQ